MISVNTNVAALLNNEKARLSGRTIGEAMERVSSGRRINAGADDPSGLGISSLRNAQIRGMGVAIENIQSAIGFLESGFSGMEQIGKLMQRMRELAVRAGNAATLSGEDLSKLDREFQSLAAEVDRTAKTTGGGSEAVAGQTPIYWPKGGKLDLIYVMDTTGSMGAYINSVKTQLSSFINTLNAAGVDWAIGVVDYRDANAAGDPFGSRAAIMTPLSSNQAAVQATLNALTANDGGDLPESGLEALTLGMTAAWRYALGTAYYSRQMIMVTDVSGPDVNHDDAAGGFAGDGMSALDTVTVANSVAAAGITAHVAGDLTAVQNQTIANTTGGLLGDINDFSNVLTNIQAAATPGGVQSAAERTKFIQVGPNNGENVQFTFEDCRIESLGANGLSISSNAGALKALTALDGAIDTLASYEAKYGTMSARLQGIMNDLFSSRINASSANSYITDADIAAEVVKLSSGRVLSETSNFVAANANTQPGAALDLLGSNNIRAENGIIK